MPTRLALVRFPVDQPQLNPADPRGLPKREFGEDRYGLLRNDDGSISITANGMTVLVDHVGYSCIVAAPLEDTSPGIPSAKAFERAASMLPPAADGRPAKRGGK